MIHKFKNNFFIKTQNKIPAKFSSYTVFLIYSDAFDLQFGVVIFRLRAGFDATDQVDSPSSRAAAFKKSSDESPPIMGERKESTVPLLPMSSSPKPKL